MKRTLRHTRLYAAVRRAPNGREFFELDTVSTTAAEAIEALQKKDPAAAAVRIARVKLEEQK